MAVLLCHAQRSPVWLFNCAHLLRSLFSVCGMNTCFPCNHHTVCCVIDTTLCRCGRLPFYLGFESRATATKVDWCSSGYTGCCFVCIQRHRRSQLPAGCPTCPTLSLDIGEQDHPPIGAPKEHKFDNRRDAEAAVYSMGGTTAIPSNSIQFVQFPRRRRASISDWHSLLKK
jgi:hypothetical protein